MSSKENIEASHKLQEHKCSKCGVGIVFPSLAADWIFTVSQLHFNECDSCAD